LQKFVKIRTFLKILRIRKMRSLELWVPLSFPKVIQIKYDVMLRMKY